MREFVPGRDLAHAYYEEVVAPLVRDVPHAAALLGWGSDVIGYDTDRSTDHGWGPRLQVFVATTDVADVSARVERGLPKTFRGWPTRFGWDAVPVRHHVEIAELSTWLDERLGLDPRRGLDAADWLALPQQLLLSITAGAVFADARGELAAVRDALAWYPDDVWLWLIACQWRRIEQEEPFVGRTAEIGDELGSRVLAARLARDAMRLCFLFERRYAPYSKWFGAAFARLDTSSELGPPLLRATEASTFAEREEALGEALLAVARRHNALGVTMPVREDLELFHGRPYRVVGAGRFVDATLQRVRDEWLRAQPLVGGIDQYVDSTDVLSVPALARRTRFVYSERP